MPYKKLEFANVCGLTPGNLYNYIKRGKVIVDAETDEIDVSLPTNKHFLEKRKARIEANKVAEYEGERPPAAKINGVTIVPNPEGTDKHVKKDSLFNLEMDQKTLNLEKAKEEIELLKLKKEKAQGIVIPTDQVKMIFAQHSKSVTVAFYNGADNLLMKIAKMKGLNRNELAEIRGELIDIINLAVKESIEESKKGIRNIVMEYSEKKGVGEHG